MTDKKYLAIFDFDYTVVNDNTDTCYWSLIPDDVKKPLLSKFNSSELTWHQLLNKLMPLLGWQTVIDCVSAIDLTPGMLGLFKFLKTECQDCKICIVSDSNTVFIEKILEVQNIRQFVDEIHTNGIAFDDNNCPVVTNYEIAFDAKRSRTCEVNCNSNHMCKGDISEKLHAKYGSEYTPFFVCDGGNDYCAMRRLDSITPKRLNFVRRGYNLERKIGG